MKKIILIFIIIVILLLIGGFSYLFVCKKSKKEEPKAEEFVPMAEPINKKIAMIIAFKDFRDEEYFTPRRVFDEAGIEVKVVSDKLGTALGADGGEVNIDIKLSDLNVADFDAIVFIGGPGALIHLDNEDGYRTAKEAVSQDKLLASICISPVVLAKAGVLKGKKATVWTSVLDKSAVKTLEENGAIYQSEDVVQDGNIITGNGPGAAEQFAKKILESL